MKLGPYTIKIVDDNATKTKYDMDFVEGGNSMAKKYIPNWEIWISCEVPEDKKPYVIVHEVIEDLLMRYKSNTYNKAHVKANTVELKERTLDKK